MMLGKSPGVSIPDKLRIIQLLVAYLNQVIIIVFARNITKLAKNHSGIILLITSMDGPIRRV
jgi:aromatic ring-opening dioxygenase LigB subunit